MRVMTVVTLLFYSFPFNFYCPLMAKNRHYRHESLKPLRAKGLRNDGSPPPLLHSA
jgi:hypothetical protein